MKNIIGKTMIVCRGDGTKEISKEIGCVSEALGAGYYRITLRSKKSSRGQYGQYYERSIVTHHKNLIPMPDYEVHDLVVVPFRQGSAIGRIAKFIGNSVRVNLINSDAVAVIVPLAEISSVPCGIRIKAG